MNVDEVIEAPLSTLDLSEPFHMSSVARHFGLVTPAIETARVLEIGCGSGGNILPIASLLPNAKMVGITTDPHEVVAAKAIAQKMGVRNVHFWQLDWNDIGPHLGQYDYIVCHDWLTRVGPDVQHAILTAIATLLAPSGVAYLSYDTKPGFDIRRLLAKFISRKAAHFSKIGERVSWKAEALLALGELAKECHGLALLGPDLPYSNAEDVLAQWMHAESTPLLFTEFAKLLAEHELQFICEADVFSWAVHSKSAFPLVHGASHVGCRVQAEQYDDFLRSRAVRHSLICHDAVTLTVPDAHRLAASVDMRGPNARAA